MPDASATQKYPGLGFVTPVTPFERVSVPSLATNPYARADPGTPWIPCPPCAPVSPLGPSGPGSPFDPWGPTVPASPCSPFDPSALGSWPGLKSAAIRVPFLTLAQLTAFFFSFARVTALL